MEPQQGLLVLAMVCLVQLTVGSNRERLIGGAVPIGKECGASALLLHSERSSAERGDSGRTRVHLAGGFIDARDDDVAMAHESTPFRRQHRDGKPEPNPAEQRKRQREDVSRLLAPVRGTSGPVHTYIKTDKNANFKWGVRHFVGKKYAR
uniref:Uncharacterized protein n=1 Tax=Anopheles atroparvus TaxID=41427 RepID=A0A182JG86_ANOAO